jgi:Ca2+-binding EF-hand superfamily protein
MKTTPVSIILVGILSSHSVLAEAPSRKERPGSDPNKRPFLDAWKNADKNGDKSLSFDEFSSLPRLQAIPEEKRAQLFQRLDKDVNNSISLNEMQHLKPSKPDGQNHSMRLWELDTDKSGGISQDEFSAGEMARKLPPDKQQKLFARLDTNKDGIISPKDRPERPDSGNFRPRHRPSDGTHSPHRPMMFPKLDINRDGFLDFDEFAKIPGLSQLGEDEQEKFFENSDTNKDLKLTPEEMANFRPPGRGQDKFPQADQPQDPSTSPAE